MLSVRQGLVKISDNTTLSTLALNFLRAYLPDLTALKFKALLEQGLLSEILRGLLRIFFTGQL